jgi:oxygen-independent coproporphyrinogen-3 oxidase
MFEDHLHISPVVPRTGMSLYLHVPFCQTKCPYCDFNTYQGIETLMAPYLEALIAEVECWGMSLDHPAVNTVFFGGGTPSYLPRDAIGRILQAVGSVFAVESGAEITTEANPGDLTSDLCLQLLDVGVNRISFGVQSLDDGLLKMLGRRHDAAQAVSAYTTARQAGFDNINLDLIYGLPHQTMSQWRDTVQRLTALHPAHVSLYCLTLEEGTPMQSWVKQGRLPEPDPDLAADMYHYAEDLLAEAGYHHYEISNWSLPDRGSRHNKAYWLNLPYLGVGPGAHSRLGEYRFWTVDSPRDYIDRVNRWAQASHGPIGALDEAALRSCLSVSGNEHIDTDLSAAETMFLGLRLLEGIDLDRASAQVGIDLAVKYRTPISELLDLALLERCGARLRLTRAAYLIANQVFIRFLE